MIHERVDIDRWIELFPLESLRAKAHARVVEKYEQRTEQWLEGALNSASSQWRVNQRDWRNISYTEALEAVRADRARDPKAWDGARLEHDLILAGPSVERITSPVHLAVAEQIRREMPGAMDVGRSVPTDVFLWSTGEPTNRATTKIGGLPYWPANRPWPTSKLGKPMVFIAQLCFADSRDIIGEIPADLLLIFADDGLPDLINTRLQFEWLPLGISDLVAAEEAPAVDPEYGLTPLFGSIHRMTDYPDLDEFDGGYERYHWGNAASILATKIGGFPWWEQGDPQLPGQWLATLESIQPVTDQPYPFANEPAPIDLAEFRRIDDHLLIWGDVGRLYLQNSGDRIYSEAQFG